MLQLRSHAKLNWHLEVLRRRADGYHELRTIFQTLELADGIELDLLDEGIELELSGESDGIGAERSNLAWRAADLFLSRFASEGAARGVRIRLEKRIPIGGGLGGGSSNAATVLAGLARLHGGDPLGQELRGAAAELGADVANFLVGGATLGLGIGDEIVPMVDEALPSTPVWLAIPPFAVPTREVFQAHRIDTESRSRAAIPPAIESLAPRSVEELLGWNDLEPTCFRLRPGIAEVYNSLSVSGASWVRLSGSGGTVCALFADAREAEKAGAALPDGTRWLATRTMNRREWRQSAGW